MTDDVSPATWQDQRSIRIDADVERVWAAWAEPEHVRRWFSDDAHGDLAVGGELVHVFDGHGEHRYTVVEVEAPHRLVLEGRMMGGEAFRQEVSIRSRDGVTTLELVHSGFGTADPDDEVVQGIDSGWSMALAVLKHYVEKHFGRDKVAIPIFRPATFDYETLADSYYFSESGRSSWLHLDRPPVDQELVRTDHEVCILWPAINGVLELKAFGSAPDQRFLGVRAVGWSPAETAVADLRSQLEGSVDRLVATV